MTWWSEHSAVPRFVFAKSVIRCLSRSLPHGHVAAVLGSAELLGLILRASPRVACLLFRNQQPPTGAPNDGAFGAGPPKKHCQQNLDRDRRAARASGSNWRACAFRGWCARTHQDGKKKVRGVMAVTAEPSRLSERHVTMRVGARRGSPRQRSDIGRGIRACLARSNLTDMGIGIRACLARSNLIRMGVISFCGSGAKLEGPLVPFVCKPVCNNNFGRRQRSFTFSFNSRRGRVLFARSSMVGPFKIIFSGNKPSVMSGFRTIAWQRIY